MSGTALAHCILGKFLGIVCHCFPPPLDVPTFAARCLYVRNDARDPSSERRNCGRERCPVILPKFRLPRTFRNLLHAANLRFFSDIRAFILNVQRRQSHRISHDSCWHRGFSAKCSVCVPSGSLTYFEKKNFP